MLKQVVPLTRALMRDQHMRRQVMFYTILVAMLMTFAGGTFLQEGLRQHLLAMVAYWFVCGWVTVAAALLALFDLLVVRAAARAARRRLEAEYLRRNPPPPE